MRALKELHDGNILIGGRIKTIGSEEIFLFKLDPSGNSIWMKTYGVSGSDFSLNAIIEARDHSSYYFTGY